MKKGVWLFAICLLCLGLVSCSMKYEYDDARLYTAGNGEMDPETVHAIDIDWISGNVTVKAYDGELLQFSDNSPYPSEENLLHYYLDGDTLKIRFCKSYSFRLSKPEPKDLEVLVPEAYADQIAEIAVDTVSAAVFVKDIQTEELDIDTVSGGITVDGAANRASIDTTSGDIALSGAFHEIETDAVSGTLTAICTECPASFEGNSVSGAFQITLPEGSEFACEYDSVSGRIISDFEGDTAENDVYKVGVGSAKFTFDTVSGDLMLSKMGDM